MEWLIYSIELEYIRPMWKPTSYSWPKMKNVIYQGNFFVSDIFFWLAVLNYFLFENGDFIIEFSLGGSGFKLTILSLRSVVNVVLTKALATSPSHWTSKIKKIYSKNVNAKSNLLNETHNLANMVEDLN